MRWKCETCGIDHEDAPLCFGIGAPWPDLVPESEFQSRVELNADLCVVDKKYFFVRGHIEIPIQEYPEVLAFSVWSSLSEKSFLHMNENWNDANREFHTPYFGWLSSPIASYPNCINLKISVQCRAPGLTPLFITEISDHQLSKDQRNGISIARWHQIAHQLLHQE